MKTSNQQPLNGRKASGTIEQVDFRYSHKNKDRKARLTIFSKVTEKLERLDASYKQVAQEQQAKEALGIFYVKITASVF